MAVSIDRFSLLPDSMLLLILSLLPFKDAIRTCVLSKRWRRTVESFNNIELNEEFFSQPNAPDEETREAQRSAFLNFATSWMDKYKDLKVVPRGGQPLRTERDMNVRHLILKTALHEDEYFGIAFTLNSCPMLERLTIEIGVKNYLVGYVPPIDVTHRTLWRFNVSAYRCLVSTLKEVEIKGFKGSEIEVVVLTRLVAHRRVLKKMCINVLKVDDDGVEDDYWTSYGIGEAKVLLTVPKA